MDMDEDEDDSAYKIVDDYTPKLGTTKISTSQTKMLDPVSGNIVDINSIGEHMRVQLIDPRWRIEQQKFLDKQKETGITQGDAITANLSKFAEKRSDIFNNSMNNDAKRAKRE
jgi:splicing factor 3A subunit 1